MNTATAFGEMGATSATLIIKRKHGGTLTVDLLGYETAHNPDAGVRYGIDNPTECQREALEPFGGASTTGIVDSHPYAVAALGRDSWVVADAGGNDLLKVSRTGHVSTIAVLPRQPAAITAGPGRLGRSPAGSWARPTWRWHRTAGSSSPSSSRAGYR